MLRFQDADRKRRRIRGTFLLAWFLVLMGLPLVGCSGSRIEDEMMIRQLDRVKEENTVLSQELDRALREKEALSVRIAQLEQQINSFQEEKNRPGEHVKGENPSALAP